GNGWTILDAPGLPANPGHTATFPAFAIHPHPVLDSGLWENEFLYATNKVYLTRTTSQAWDPISPVLTAGRITALKFAPSQSGVYYVGTTLGEVFVTLNGGADN